jgi:Ca2+-binding RTX toxin-like protein
MPIIDKAGITITAAGVYKLDRDLTFNAKTGAAITIAADNVVIDLNGHTIRGSNAADTSAYGIVAMDRTNVTVKNGSINGFQYGIYLSDLIDSKPLDGGRHLIQNVDISDSTFRGIRVEGLDNVVRDCTISDIGGTTLYANAYAFGIESFGPNARILSNTVTDVRGFGIQDVGEGVGISISRHGDGSIVAGNVIRNSAVEVGAGYGDWPAQSRSTYGVWIGGDGSSNIHVNNNTIDNFVYGITFKRTVAGDFAGNNVTHAIVPYYLPFNDAGTRVVDLGGNISDIGPTELAFGRTTPAQVETVELIYLSPLHRGRDFLFVPLHNPDDNVSGNTLDGGAGLQMVDYWRAASAVIVDLQTGNTSGGGGNDVLANVEGAQGTEDHGDTLLGNTGRNLLAGSGGDDAIFGKEQGDWLFGDEGNDMIAGGSGADLIDGGEGLDYARYDDGHFGRLVVSLKQPGRNTGAAAGDKFLSIEGLVLGDGSDFGYGDDRSNYIYGMSGEDSLAGGLGADYLHGGAGTDYARYDDANYGNLIVSLLDSTINTGAAKGDRFVAIEGLFLGSGNDRGYGDNGDNSLYGMSGNDVLIGNDGFDNLLGGNGNDILNGGCGADRLSGNLGNDTFVFRDGYGADVVLDFAGGRGVIDRIDFRTVFDSFREALVASKQVGADLVFTISDTDTLTLRNFYRGNLHADDILF